uniref:Calponin-homology (CH) domain-containing protein n=1 Tax=Monopterus albus TaxID=43700 RepID=A0A3Q3K0A4_MONAL
MDRELSEDELQDLYAWLDKIPLSRPKRHITRDFSDGVMTAEVVKHFLPKLVDLHNYIPANSTPQKLNNWSLLNRKVFSKLNFHVPVETVRRIVLNTAGVIEPVLSTLREQIDKKLEPFTNNNLVCTICLHMCKFRKKPEVLTHPCTSPCVCDMRIEDLTRHLEMYKQRTGLKLRH